MLTLDYRPKKLNDLIGQPHIQKICKGIFKKFKETGYLPNCILLGGGFGCGKCITGDSLVLTTKGFVKIKNIPLEFRGTRLNPGYGENEHFEIKVPLQSYTWENDKKHIITNSSNWLKMERADVITVETINGYKITGTYEHPVYTQDGFKKLSDLTMEDSIMVAVGTRLFGTQTPYQSSYPSISEPTWKDMEVPKEILMGTFDTQYKYLKMALESGDKIGGYRYLQYTETLQIMLLNMGILSQIKDVKKQHTLIYNKNQFENETTQITKNQYALLRIKRMEKSNRPVYVYDFHVPETHCFIANGIVNHNTTTARIIARYLNCEKDVTNACGECSSCKAMDRDANPSVIEIDAASNRGIANVLELQESLKFTTPYRKRVVIIDECHQLSKEAVQAMLKTFEETDKALFIMCTTEVDEVLDTIKSRSIQMLVNTIPQQDLEQRLSYIAEKENINISSKAISMIVNLSDGHARDALQLLDTARYYVPETKQIKVQSVLSCAGYSNSTIAQSIIEKFINKDNGIIDIFKECKESPVKIIKTILRLLQNEINYSCQGEKKKMLFPDCNLKDLIDLDCLFHSAQYYFGLNTGWSIYVLYHYFNCWKKNDLDNLPRIR